MDWITSQDKASTLDRIVEQCGKALESLSDNQYEAVCMEIAQTDETWAQDLMKEVIGTRSFIGSSWVAILQNLSDAPSMEDRDRIRLVSCR